MNVMGRFTLRSMRANRKWTVVTLLGIIISTAMLPPCPPSARLHGTDANESIADNGNWHAMVSDVPMRDVPVFEDAGFVEEISLSRDVGYARLEDSKNENKPYLFIRHSVEAAVRAFYRAYRGRMPQNDGELCCTASGNKRRREIRSG